MNDELAEKHEGKTREQVRAKATKPQGSSGGKQYPLLDCEKRIFDLVKKLWEMRGTIEA